MLLVVDDGGGLMAKGSVAAPKDWFPGGGGKANGFPGTTLFFIVELAVVVLLAPLPGILMDIISPSFNLKSVPGSVFQALLTAAPFKPCFALSVCLKIGIYLVRVSHLNKVTYL